MIELIRHAKRTQDFFEQQRWRFCFIGGLAVMRWGEPRFTRDIDITLLTGFSREEQYIDDLLSHFSPRREDMKEFALKNRVVLLQSPEGYPVDVALGGLPFEEQMVERSSLYEYDDSISLRTCSAEDLVVMKAFAERDADWADIRTIVVRQGDALDWNYVIKQLSPLCEVKDSAHILERLESCRKSST